jgi:hypothetical protein
MFGEDQRNVVVALQGRWLLLLQWCAVLRCGGLQVSSPEENGAFRHVKLTL